MTVVDICAQVGHYTVLSAMRVGPSGKVFAFEPEPKRFRLLCRNLSANGLTIVFVEQKALLNQNRMQHSYLVSENLGRHGIYRQNDSEEQIEVETTKLDQFCSNREEKVQVIKLDAEGGEPLILKGMKRVISESSSLAPFTEFFLPNLEAGSHSPEAYLNELVRHGFTLYPLDEERKTVRKVGAGQMLEICCAQPELVRNLLCMKNWDLQVAEVYFPPVFPSDIVSGYRSTVQRLFRTFGSLSSHLRK
jgi:FkbM family methyltransferase